MVKATGLVHVQADSGSQSSEPYLPLNLSTFLRTPGHTHPKSKLWGLLLYYYEVWNLNFPKGKKRVFQSLP